MTEIMILFCVVTSLWFSCVLFVAVVMVVSEKLLIFDLGLCSSDISSILIISHLSLTLLLAKWL